jgi:hypothetical protein
MTLIPEDRREKLETDVRALYKAGWSNRKVADWIASNDCCGSYVIRAEALTIANLLLDRLNADVRRANAAIAREVRECLAECPSFRAVRDMLRDSIAQRREAL